MLAKRGLTNVERECVMIMAIHLLNIKWMLVKGEYLFSDCCATIYQKQKGNIFNDQANPV